MARRSGFVATFIFDAIGSNGFDARGTVNVIVVQPCSRAGNNMPSAMPVLYEQYDRRQIRDMLAPNEPFTAGAGKWGLHGILPIPGRPGDFVFFASLGQSTGGHTFDEGISTEGILRWQSQPKQTLINPTIRALIEHDDAVNVIHFFLRTKNLTRGTAQPYTYLGPLRYNSHDDQREEPVHFAWELVQWPIPEAIRDAMGLVLDEEEARPVAIQSGKPLKGLTLISAPPGQHVGETTRTFQARKFRRKSESESRELGLSGELLVFEYEKSRLKKAGQPKLANLVKHVSVEKGDGAGHDIRSFNDDGSDRLIEVKTTTGPAGTPFYISANEVAFSLHAPDAFVIYRLVNFDKASGSAGFYKLPGPVEVSHKLVPTTYRAYAKPD